MSKHATSPDTPRRYVTVPEAAAHLGVSKSWLDKSRLRGDGPAFIRIGGNVRYRLEDLDAFADRHRRNSTSERGAA
jgi:predicted DNA-binding transcriptional regulator AlpA